MTEPQLDVLTHFVALILLGGVGLLYLWKLAVMVLPPFGGEPAPPEVAE